MLILCRFYVNFMPKGLHEIATTFMNMGLTTPPLFFLHNWYPQASLRKNVLIFLFVSIIWCYRIENFNNWRLNPHSNLWQGTTTLPNLAMFCNEITCMVDGYSRALKGCLLKAFPPLNVLWDRTWARPCSLSCFS